MKAALARAMVAVAASCLGESRRDWAVAMRAELEEWLDEGNPLPFAAGCLVAAWRELPRHEEGRRIIVGHALALGLLLPIAALQLAAGLSSILLGGVGPFGGPGAGFAQSVYLGDACPNALPALLGLWLWLCLLQLRFAWLLLDGDWAGVGRVGSLSAAATATLLIFNGILYLGEGRVALQAVALGVQLGAAFMFARWHGRLFPPSELIAAA